MSLNTLISDDYRKLNRQLHDSGLPYGISGHAYADTIIRIAEIYGTNEILDYGCGKGTLKRSIQQNAPDLKVFEYDPCIAGKEATPQPADIVICNDVLEHIEPECLQAVLADLARVTKKIGFFVVDLFPANKCLPDGRNTHLIQETDTFWRQAIEAHMSVVTVASEGIRKLIFIVKPKAKQSD